MLDITKNIDTLYVKYIYHRNHESVLVAKAGGDRENRVEAGKHGAKKQHFTRVWIDGHFGQMVTERCQVFVVIKCVL